MTRSRIRPRNPPSHATGEGGRPSANDSAQAPGRHRFLAWDDYRVEREWRRYEGTPLRDLYRELRERFLGRHRPPNPGRSLEIGPGPGRFTHLVGHPDDRVALLELSRAMLGRIQSQAEGRRYVRVDLVQGDAVTPPFRAGQFHRVAMLGNVLGFAEGDAAALLANSASLVAPGGKLLLEFVSGPGERSRYLHRLPAGAIARLLAAPVRAVQPRVEREGFDRIRERETGGRHFRRIRTGEIERLLSAIGLETREVVAVAPCLGIDASRLSVVRSSPAAWNHLLELEEAIGREAGRQTDAAAILVAAERAPI